MRRLSRAITLGQGLIRGSISNCPALQSACVLHNCNLQLHAGASHSSDLSCSMQWDMDISSVMGRHGASMCSRGYSSFAQHQTDDTTGAASSSAGSKSGALLFSQQSESMAKLTPQAVVEKLDRFIVSEAWPWPW